MWRGQGQKRNVSGMVSVIVGVRLEAIGDWEVEEGCIEFNGRAGTWNMWEGGSDGHYLKVSLFA